MSAPDYLICLECETPCYIFEWDNGKITEAQCTTCGNDEVDSFSTPSDFEDMAWDRRWDD